MTTPWTFPLPEIPDAPAGANYHASERHAEQQERLADEHVGKWLCALILQLDNDGLPGLRSARLLWTYTRGLSMTSRMSYLDLNAGVVGALAHDLASRTDVPTWLVPLLRVWCALRESIVREQHCGPDRRLEKARAIIDGLASLTSQVEHATPEGEWRVIRAPGSDTVRVRVVKETARTCLVELAEPAGGLAVGATLTLRRTKADAAFETDGFVYDAR